MRAAPAGRCASRPAARISPMTPAAADDRHVVAHGAARAVERRAKPLLGRLDFEEVIEPEPELFEIDRRRCRPAARRAVALRVDAQIDSPRELPVTASSSDRRAQSAPSSRRLRGTRRP